MPDHVHTALRDDLRRLLGDASVLDPAEHGPYCSDFTRQRGLRGEPQAVICPDGPAAVAKALGYCYRRQLGIVPRGGGTGLAGGATPVGGGVVFSMERMRKLQSLRPEQRSMVVQAGLSTAHVARLAREQGLLFAPDPGAAEQSQIGGNVATNAGGPHAFKYGRTAAAVTGLEVALAPGEVVQFGGAGRRDSSGYDLVGLMVGSEGTLGILTSVALRLHPAPESSRALVAIFEDRQHGCAALGTLLACGLQPAVLDFVDGSALVHTLAGFPVESVRSCCAGRPGFMLLLEADGSEAEAGRLIAELHLTFAEAGSVCCEELSGPALWRWRDGIGMQVAALRGGRTAADIALPSGSLAQALERLEAIAGELGLEQCSWGHAGDGIIHVSFLADPADGAALAAAERAGRAAMELALSLDGSITGEHGVGWVKRELLSRAWTPAQAHAQLAIKRALDPRGLLNPGKKLPKTDASVENATS